MNGSYQRIRAPIGRRGTIHAGPPERAAERRSRGTVFPALAVRGFRIYALYLALAAMGVWVQRVAQDWLLLELTGDLALVGLSVSLQFLPTLLLGALVGTIADRYDPRRVLQLTTGCSLLTALTVAVLGFTGLIEPWQVYAVVLVHGLSSAVENPTRWVLVSRLIEARAVRSAISVKSFVIETAGLSGPLLSGLIVAAFGTSWALILASATALLSFLVLVRVPRTDSPVAPDAGRTVEELRPLASFVAGIRYALQRPVLLWAYAICLVYSACFFPMSVILLDYANHRFDLGSSGYGLLTAILGLGAAAGAMISIRVGRTGIGYLLAVSAATGVLHLAAALLQDRVAFAAALLCMGVIHVLFGTAMNATVQANSGLDMRGRAMALYYVVINGGVVCSAAVVGGLADRLGGSWALALTGVLPMVLALPAWALWRTAARRREPVHEQK